MLQTIFIFALVYLIVLPTTHVDGIGGTSRRMRQYEDEMLEHMLDAGTAPGGGNRSHLVDALSHMDKEMRQLVHRPTPRFFSSLRMFYFIVVTSKCGVGRCIS